MKDQSAAYVHAETIIGIVFALGGIKNIQDVENCMSRLRIRIKSPVSTEDKEFLALGAMGIVRLPDQIHLIYGTASIALKEAFMYLLQIDRNPSLLSLICAAGGADNIADLTEHDAGVRFRLKSPPALMPLPGFTIERSGLFLDAVSTSGLPPVSARELHYTLAFWNFLYTLQLYRAFSPYGIRKISSCRARVRIKLASDKDIVLSCPLLGLDQIPFRDEELEVQIPAPARSEAYASLLERLLKTEKKRRK